MGLKGFAILTIAIVGIIVTFTAILAIVVPLLTLKYHLAIEVKNTYEYNNAELALLSLVSKKHNDESMYRILSERGTNGFDSSVQEDLKGKLALLTYSKCFKLVSESETILEPENCDPVENTGGIYLFTPYNQNSLVEKITLVYT
jgi:hypothetical protein